MASSHSSGPDQVTVIRKQVARGVQIVTSVFAVVLVLGIVLAVFADNVNEDNAVASFLLNFSELVDGPFSRDGGVFDFNGDNAGVKEAITNWGLAAIAWVVVGRIVSRLLAR